MAFENGLRLGVAAGVSLLVVTHGPPVEACSPNVVPRCSGATAAPRQGAMVPATIPALLYAPATLGSTTTPSFEGFQLLDGTGQPVDLAFEETAPNSGAYYARPKATLVPDTTYKMRFPQLTCPNDGTAPQPATAEQSFTTTAATPIPTTLGTASMTGRMKKQVTVWTSAGTCSTEITASLTHVTVQPSPELRAFLEVAFVAALVDGKYVALADQHVDTAAGTVELDILTSCDVKDPYAERGLAPGRYKLELRAHVMGEKFDPLPIWTDIETSCDGELSGYDKVQGGCGIARGRDDGAGGTGLVALALLILRRRKAAR